MNDFAKVTNRLAGSFTQQGLLVSMIVVALETDLRRRLRDMRLKHDIAPLDFYKVTMPEERYADRTYPSISFSVGQYYPNKFNSTITPQPRFSKQLLFKSVAIFNLTNVQICVTGAESKMSHTAILRILKKHYPGRIFVV